MTKTTATKPARQCHLAWVKADDLAVNPVAQREFRPQHAQNILAKFDIDKFQVPHVNKRNDGTYYVMEGQHSIWAYRAYFGDGQQVQAWLYDGLTEAEEAEFFLSLNDKKAVDAMAKFKVGVTAGRDLESDIDRIVRANGCIVSKNAGDNHIGAIGTVIRIYQSYGGSILGQTIRIIQGSFAEGGYEVVVLMGIAQVLSRYSLEVDNDRLIQKLAGVRNGWKGLVQRANIIRASHGVTTTEAAAAAVVEFYNSGRGGVKLMTWWSEDGAA